MMTRTTTDLPVRSVSVRVNVRSVLVSLTAIGALAE
jgi:hypothetical protein